MQYINTLKEGDNVNEIYLCRVKRTLTAKTGKAYDSLTLQDKTGTIDAKIWDLGSMGINDFSELDYIDVTGNVTSFQGHLQLNIRRVRRCRENEYDPAQYLPLSRFDNDKMYEKLLELVDSVKGPDLHALLEAFFRKDPVFVKAFRASSAAKAVHHGFVGGLLEHTLGVGRLCSYLAGAYPFLNRDLLVSTALLHDIGKTRELSLFPENDYTDDGQFLGHIVIGVEMVDEKLKDLPGFPALLASEVKHCILAHHGEFEYGSPKKPAIAEAAALNFADNADAKLEIFRELYEQPAAESGDWYGFNRLLDSNIRKT